MTARSLPELVALDRKNSAKTHATRWCRCGLREISECPINFSARGCILTDKEKFGRVFHPTPAQRETLRKAALEVVSSKPPRDD